MADDDLLDLTGSLLVAMPGMGDPRFDRAVIFLCDHSKDGAMGFIVNKPVPEMAIGDLLHQLELQADGPAHTAPVHFGGPVENGRGFVLHSTDYQSGLKTLNISDEFGMTATVDVLEAIAAGRGPERALVMLGYSGWGPGQLESEIARNGWLTVGPTTDLVFGSEDGRKWTDAIKSMGIDPLGLSGAAGRA